MLVTGLLLAPFLLAVAATPAPDRLPALAADLERALEGAKVRTPDGAETGVLGTALDRERIAASLATISEAEGWPASWLVVQDLGLDWDLVLRVRLDEAGTLVRPETIFATSRREWDDDAFDAAYREATGKKPPRERSRNLVVHSFAKRVVTTYVYEVPTGSERKGLLAMLPEGSLLREAKSVSLGDGRHHTLALVLVRPRFVPSTCADEREIARGHEDEGEVLLVLAGEKALEGRLDVSDRFVPEGGGAPRVPRYPCREGDAAETSSPIADRFRDRATLPLLLFDEKATKGEGILVEARRRASDRQEERVRLARIVMGDGGARLLEERGSGPAERHGHRHGHGHGDHDDATVTHRFEGPEEWAKRFDDPSRDAWQKPQEVLRLLSVKEGMAVGDLGAGTGYFSIPLGRAVGPRGTVWGIDVEPGMVEYLGARAEREGLPNVKGVLTKPDDPGLAPGSADLVLVVNTWHHIDDRIDYLGKLRKTLRPGGRVAVVDYKIGDLPVGPPEGHKLSPEKVVGEFAAGGFEVVLRDETTLPYQYVLAFAPR